MTVVLVTGGRAYLDETAVEMELSALGSISRLVEGGATGADRLAATWAERHGIPVSKCRPIWRDKDGVFDPRAAFKRNQTMLDTYMPDLLVAFPGGGGTADMVCRARRAGVPVREAGTAGLWDALLG